MADYIHQKFEEACKVLDGEVKHNAVTTICEIHPHDTATVQIVLQNGSLKEINAENELANTVIRYPFPGDKIREINVREDKKLVFIALAGNDTCTITRLPRIVKGSCVISGRTVDFAFDP